MYPTGQPADGAPVQGSYEGYPAHPVVTATVQHAIVSIPTQPPKDYIVWSLCNLVYSNPCCLGLIALIFSIRARDRKMVGDLDGARYFGATARTLNISATALVVFSFLITIITVIVVTTQAARAANSYNSYGGYNYRG